MMCSLLVHYVGRKVIQFIHFIVPKIKFKLHKNSQLSRWAQMTSYWLENLTRQKYWIIIRLIWTLQRKRLPFKILPRSNS